MHLLGPKRRNFISFCFVVSFSEAVPLNLSMTRGGGRRSGNRGGASVSIRSEQNTEGSNGLDIWLGRGAMIGFAVAITVEIATGKGLLEVTSSKLFLLLTSEFRLWKKK
ncbi:hypothetical protein EUTSA_v10026482mg [Eutrema salsugineum]|uniref:Uncharacterized protein n=1 Tax=Eutrema salsugineum TaxID=72664 RepID=V4P2W2_EUTSA|nr:hypothetical protein EUTSA_v10026482mg [Eutrema salsugineum]